MKTISLLNPKKELEQIYLVLSHLMGKRVSENHIGPKNIFTKDSLKNATVLKINLNFQSDNNTDYNLERHDQEENVSNNDSGCSKLYFDDESKTKNDTSFSKKRIKKNLVTGKQKKLIFENKLVSPVYLKQFFYYNCAIYDLQLQTNFKSFRMKTVFRVYYQIITLTILVSWIRKQYGYSFDIVICNWNNDGYIHKLFESNVKSKFVYDLMKKYKCFYINDNNNQ